MADKILILGAGNAQIDAIEYCKSKGYEVVGCSYTTVDNGIPYLDYFEHVDIKDVDGVVAIAKKYDAKLIYSIGSDIAMPTVMEASERLNLPHFISGEIAKTCQSKVKMRKALGQDFEGNIPFMECSNLEEALTFKAFPAMMKPTDSQGQRGCFKVESIDDIKKEFQTSMDFSHEGKVILEKFVAGPEVSANAYFQDGEMRCCIISDRVVFDEFPGGIIKEHILPSKASAEVQKKVNELVKTSAEKLGIKNGPCYFQIKIDENDNPIIIEITPRLDGCHMWNLIKHYAGIDLLDACFVHLLDGKDALADNKFEIELEATSTGQEHKLVFMSQAPWTKFSKDKFDVSNSEYHFYYYNDGDKVRRLNGYIEKCGYMICKTHPHL